MVYVSYLVYLFVNVHLNNFHTISIQEKSYLNSRIRKNEVYFT